MGSWVLALMKTMTLKLLKRALVWMTCLLWKETLRMPPEWKKSTNCFRLFIYKSKDLILDINPPNNVFSPYLTLPIMASFFVSGKPIHTLGCVVSEYMCQKKEKYTQSLSILKLNSFLIFAPCF